MKKPAPVYTLTRAGLTTECRIIQTHEHDKEMVLIETSLGEFWVSVTDLRLKVTK